MFWVTTGPRVRLAPTPLRTPISDTVALTFTARTEVSSVPAQPTSTTRSTPAPPVTLGDNGVPRGDSCAGQRGGLNRGEMARRAHQAFFSQHHELLHDPIARTAQRARPVFLPQRQIG